MAVISFDATGAGTRAGANNGRFQLAVPSGAADTTAQFVIYNEADSTVNLNFDVQDATGHFVSTNDQAGNEIFIRDGADQLIIAPLSAAVVTVGRNVAATAATDGVIINPPMTYTSHRTVSAAGERIIIETVVV